VSKFGIIDKSVYFVFIIKIKVVPGGTLVIYFMVILGFRPKASSSVSGSTSVSDTTSTSTSNKSETKENISKSSNTRSNSNNNPSTSQDVKAQKKKNQSSSSLPVVQNVSSNWKRLKALKVFKTSDSSSSTSAVKNVSDAEWFGVKNVEEFAASRENEILRENVSPASLFPPIPANVSESKISKASKFIALDCEMVGAGVKGFESVLARVSVVNFHGVELLDVYVRPTRKITDYRTSVSGVTARHLTPSRGDPSVNLLGQPLLSLKELQERLIPLLADRIVVGHALHNDFAALLLSSNHPRRLIRDTSRYGPFRALSEGRNPGLKMLAARILGVQIQSREHDSVDDARIAMLLYRSVKSQWENSIFTHRKTHKFVKTTKKDNEEDANDKDSTINDNYFTAFL
jgi:RNA exonuclease 4